MSNRIIATDGVTLLPVSLGIVHSYLVLINNQEAEYIDLHTIRKTSEL